jgi:hypothetical protein
MPNETGTAFLVDPMGHAPKSLTETEYHKLSFLLEICRNEHMQVAAETLDWMLTSINKYHATSPDEILLQVIWEFVNNHVHDRCGGYDVDGVLTGHHQSIPVHWITKPERETLANTLAAIRLESWFGEWLALQVGTIANGEGFPGDRHPTPLQIAASLVDCIREHEDTMETARKFAQMRPDLVLGATLEPLATQEPPAAPEVPQPTRKGTTGHPRARKPRKKVGHAA